MTLIDRHVLREWLETLAIVLVATVGLLVMASLYDELEDLLRMGASVGEIGVYFAVKIPGFLVALLPLGLLTSLLYALGRLHHANELVALRAAGIGLARITRSVWAAGVMFCGLVWWLNGSVVPWSVEQSRRAWETLQVRRELAGKPADQAGLRPALTFDQAEAGRRWFINRFSRLTGRAYGVTVSELDDFGRELRRTLAREAFCDEAGGGWVLRDGRVITFDPVIGEVVRTEAFQEVRRVEFDEDPELMLVYDARPDALSLRELARVIEHHREAGSPRAAAYELRRASILAESLMPLVIIAFAVPFAVAGVRVNPAVGVSKALGLFLLYFFAQRVGLLLGGRGVLQPWTAALLPHFAFLGAGAWAWLRLR